MSCGCSGSTVLSDCDNQNACTPCDNSIESVASQLSNLIAQLLGTFTKTTVNGRSTWSAVCSPTQEISGYPKLDGEGFICYLLRIIPLITGIPGPQGPAGPAGSGSAINYSVRTINASSAANNTDAVINCASMGAPTTVTLPALNTLLAGKWFIVKTDGSQAVTITPSGGNTIDGASSLVLTIANESVTLVSDNSNKWITI